MGYEVIKITEDTWRIEDGGVRFFLLKGRERALLIDSGMQVENVKDIAAHLTDLPLSLLNTHGDRDHVGGNDEFASFYMHPAEEENYRATGHGGEIIPVEEGDVLDLGERPLLVIHLPGHTPGSIALLDQKYRVLISGDPIQEDGDIFMFGQFRDMPTYIQSLKHLGEYAGQFDEIWPSHAKPSVSPDIIPGLIAGAQRVAAGEIKGSPILMFGRPAVRYDLGFTRFLCEK